MKRYLIFLSAFVATIAVLCALFPSKAAMVMNYYKAATISSTDAIFVFKKAASGKYETQVAAPLTINTVANGGTGASTAAGARAALGIAEYHTNAVAGFKTAIGLQSGSLNTTNDLSSTITFATAYSAAPIVVLTSVTNALPHLIATTTTNFTFGVAVTNQTVNWVAIGAP